MAELPQAVAMAIRRRSSNAFERHGIDHLSASSINAWISNPALWIMERLLQRKTPTGCAAFRGAAVEAGISHGLFNPSASLDDCDDIALATFDELAARSSDPKREDERANIPDMVGQGLTALRPLGVPTKPLEGNQHRVEINLDDVPVPVIGFLDFEFSGLVIDTKSTLRIPSEMSAPHKRQAAIYQTARSNSAVTFQYISPKKTLAHTLDRQAWESSMAELRHSAMRLHTFLSLSADANELAQLVTPDFSMFHWNDPVARDLGRQVYGY